MNIQNTVCLTFQLMSDRGNANPEYRMYGWETVALTKKQKEVNLFRQSIVDILDRG